MLLYLIRHGESTDNAGTTPPLPDSASELERQRSLDAHLTDHGRRQVERTGAWLASREITHLYASLMVRALQSGILLSRHLNLPVHALAHLCEYRTGTGFAGLPRAEIEALFPECRLPQECGDEGWWDRSVEDEAAAYLRAERAARDLRSLHADTDDRVAVVTHGLFGSALISVLLGAPPCGYKRFPMENAAVSLLELEGKATRLCLHNFTPPEEGE